MTPDVGTAIHNCTFWPVNRRIKNFGTFSIHLLHTLFKKNTKCRQMKMKGNE